MRHRGCTEGTLNDRCFWIFFLFISRGFAGFMFNLELLLCHPRASRPARAPFPEEPPFASRPMRHPPRLCGSPREYGGRAGPEGGGSSTGTAERAMLRSRRRAGPKGLGHREGPRRAGAPAPAGAWPGHE